MACKGACLPISEYVTMLEAWEGAGGQEPCAKERMLLCMHGVRQLLLDGAGDGASGDASSQDGGTEGSTDAGLCDLVLESLMQQLYVAVRACMRVRTFLSETQPIQVESAHRVHIYNVSAAAKTVHTTTLAPSRSRAYTVHAMQVGLVWAAHWAVM